jgi:hypothetical protein
VTDGDSWLARVATKIANGKPQPEWLVDLLRRFAWNVGQERVDPRAYDDAVLEAIRAIDVLDREIYFEATIVEAFGFELDDRVDVASTALTELRDFFEEQRRPSRNGGPTPDSRRWLCARVCADAWRRLHGEPQPYSQHLQEACEEYWQACGHPASDTGNIKKWERYLVATTP